MDRTERLLIEAFHDTGWETERQPFHLENVQGAQDFGEGLPANFPVLEGVNILARKQGAINPGEALVVVAHYDTRPDTPGADDNTASVACLLELARILRAERFRRTVILAATDMEELLSVGARALVPELEGKYRVRGALVLETLAYVDPKPHTLRLESKPGLLYRNQWKRMERHDWAATFTLGIYRQDAADLAATFASGLQLLTGHDDSILARDPGELPLVGFFLRRVAPGLVRQFHRSDHTAFWSARIPAVQITDGADFGNPHYHRPTDLPATLNFPRLRAVTGALAMVLAVHGGLCT
ncbi:MAG TPA: M20/M25/M40 family metallo-hydrolase [Thermoplasmata archaeon]|nr:M20/M25/M40 family metallo-hydrolase [Thermoplasmata archaeon]